MNDNFRNSIYDDEAFSIMARHPYDYDKAFVSQIMSMRSEWFIPSKLMRLQNFLWFVRFGNAVKESEILSRRIELIENNIGD